MFTVDEKRKITEENSYLCKESNSNCINAKYLKLRNQRVSFIADSI